MGLDITITKGASAIFNTKKKCYEYKVAPYFNFEQPDLELNQLYWRKFADLHKFIWKRHQQDLDDEWKDNGVDIVLTKDDFEQILYFISHNPDYYSRFTHLPELAFILYHWEDYVKEGIKWIYNGSY